MTKVGCPGTRQGCSVPGLVAMALPEGFFVFQQTVSATWTYPASDPTWKLPLQWGRITIFVLPLPTTNRC